MPEKICEHCGVPFHVFPYSLDSRRFCSRACHYASKRNQIQCVCQNCGRKFTKPPSDIALGRGKYCSQECFKAKAVRELAPHWRGKTVITICEHCRKPFQVQLYKKRKRPKIYCSKECATLATTIEITCVTCGKSLRVSRSRKNPMYCSHACRALAQRKITGPQHPLYKERVTQMCPTCGHSFEVSEYEIGHKVYCSPDCHGQAHGHILKVCENCNREYLAHTYRADESHYCSTDCYRQAKGEHIENVCLTCGKLFHVLPSLANTKRFCSRKCYKAFTGPTSLEQLLLDEFERRSLQPEFQYPLGRWTIDFAFPDETLAIEADGRYWHESTEAKEKDARKDHDLQAQGWTVLRFGEYEIQTSPAACVDQIIKHLL